MEDSDSETYPGNHRTSEESTQQPKTTPNASKKRKAFANIIDNEVKASTTRRSLSLCQLEPVSESKKFKNQSPQPQQQQQQQVTSTPAANKITSGNLISTATAKLKLSESNKSSRYRFYNNQVIEEGLYFGKGKHVDGKQIRIIYQRKFVNDEFICVWISRDPFSDKSIVDYSMDQSLVISSIVYLFYSVVVELNI
jgi:hypothetical protein